MAVVVGVLIAVVEKIIIDKMKDNDTKYTTDF